MKKTPYRTVETGLISVFSGDGRDLLDEFPENTFDCVITDPPYSVGITRNEISGPRWDHSRIAFDQDFWAKVRRVTKPGATMAVFGHPKTFARMAVAIEDAGYTMVDTLAWIHGQGYAAGYRHLDQELKRLGASELAASYSGWGNMLRPAFEPIIIARNITAHQSLPEVISRGGVGGLNIDACRISAGDENRSRTPGRTSPSATWRIDRLPARVSTPPEAGRMPSNVLLEHNQDCTERHCTAKCPIAQVRRDGHAVRGRNEDASRFYQTFLHHPKATQRERPQVDGLSGPTVKPVGVMDWLVSLVARPGQLVLDPFAGTGTTLEACAKVGVRSVGFEREQLYMPLIQKRLSQFTLVTPSALDRSR